MMSSPQAIAIILSSADRATLEGWTRRRKTAQSLALWARIVLACAVPGATNGRVAKRMGVSRPTVATWRRRFAERGPDGLLDEPRSGRPRSITDEQVERAVVNALEHSISGQGRGAEPVSGGADLACLRAAAAPLRNVQAIARSSVR